MVEIPTYQIGIFVFDVTFSIEKKCAKTCPDFGLQYIAFLTKSGRSLKINLYGISVNLVLAVGSGDAVEILIEYPVSTWIFQERDMSKSTSV